LLSGNFQQFTVVADWVGTVFFRSGARPPFLQQLAHNARPLLSLRTIVLLI
jgi:hypothetical protein